MKEQGDRLAVRLKEGLFTLCTRYPESFARAALIKLSEKKHLYWVIVVMKLVMIPASIVVSVEAVPHVARIPGDHIDGWNVLIGSITWALAAAFISATVGVKQHRSAAA